MTARPDYARELRYTLTDPVKLCRDLGLDSGSKRQSTGLTIQCPAHKEKSPSCSVTVAEDGTVRVHCFGCGWSTDALGLIAHVNGLQIRTQFPDVLAEAALVAGRSDIADELRTGRQAPDRLPPIEPPPAAPPRDYPPVDEVKAIWESALPVTDDQDACRYLVFRRLDPELIAARRLFRVVVPPLPPWAVYGQSTWLDTGHRMICRMFDAAGVVRSIRAIRIVDGDSPKRLPPKGHRASELVLANESACRMLRGRAKPERVIVTEGEPDHATWCMRTTEPVLGLISGSWTVEFAARLPRWCSVVIRTHTDEAGDRYAAEVMETLHRDCRVLRVNAKTGATAS